jgi:Flp pilus assembly protein TadG
MRRLHPLPNRHDDERGVVAVWVALTMIVMLGFAGWAVDFSHWNNERTKMQKAADAAALAGAVYLPDDAAGAIAAAKSIAAQNGYPTGVSVKTLDSANQLKVTINTNVKSSLAQAVGIGSADLSKHAVSEFESPKPLDVVLILDRTSSMTATDLANVKDASLDMLQFLNPRNESVALGVLGPSDKAKTCGGANAGAYGLPSSIYVDTPTATWIAAPYPYNTPLNDYKIGKTLNSASQIVKTINCLTTGSRTDLGDPIAAATTYLHDYGRAGAKQGIILMTDGEANEPATTQQPCQYANDAATAAKAKNIQVLTIGFGVAGAKCGSDTKATSSFRSVSVTKLLATMASPIKGVAAVDNGCTDAENKDGDNFFCEPKTGDLSSVFLQAIGQLANRLPRIIE